MYDVHHNLLVPAKLQCLFIKFIVFISHFSISMWDNFLEPKVRVYQFIEYQFIEYMYTK